MKELCFDIHGILVKIKTTHHEFAEFVAENYSIFSTELETKPDIMVTFSPEMIERTHQAFQHHSYLGNDVYISENSILWKNDFGFRTLVRHNSPRIKVIAYHQELSSKQEKSERYKNYQRCMRWAIHYPLFTYFQYRKDWEILHGSAVSNGQQTIAFCGLNKMGKSTLAIHMCCEQGYDLLTDNYLLYDGERIYAFPEVIRLGERSVDRYNLTPIWDHKIYDKYHVDPTKIGVRMQATPDALFILSRNDQLKIRGIESKSAWQTMDNLHSMLGEFPEQGYMAAWPLVSGRTRESIAENNSLYQTPWYLLTYEPNWDIEVVIGEINRCI